MFLDSVLASSFIFLLLSLDFLFLLGGVNVVCYDASA